MVVGSGSKAQDFDGWHIDFTPLPQAIGFDSTMNMAFIAVVIPRHNLPHVPFWIEIRKWILIVVKYGQSTMMLIYLRVDLRVDLIVSLD